jgi:exonuclease VII large subunit
VYDRIIHCRNALSLQFKEQLDKERQELEKARAFLEEQRKQLEEEKSRISKAERESVLSIKSQIKSNTASNNGTFHGTSTGFGISAPSSTYPTVSRYQTANSLLLKQIEEDLNKGEDVLFKQSQFLRQHLSRVK